MLLPALWAQRRIRCANCLLRGSKEDRQGRMANSEWRMEIANGINAIRYSPFAIRGYA